MSLSPEVDLDSLIVRNDPLSGAIIAAIMQEAGLRAVRKNRYNIIQADLEEAYSSQVKGAQEKDKFDFVSINLNRPTSYIGPILLTFAVQINVQLQYHRDSSLSSQPLSLLQHMNGAVRIHPERYPRDRNSGISQRLH